MSLGAIFPCETSICASWTPDTLCHWAEVAVLRAVGGVDAMFRFPMAVEVSLCCGSEATICGFASVGSFMAVDVATKVSLATKQSK